MSASENILNVCLMGSPAAGKTCFIAGLSILGEPNRKSPFTIASKGTGYQYLLELGKILRQGVWPPATNVTERIEAEIRYKGSDLHLTLLDYPGGQMDKLASRDNSTIRELDQTWQEADVFLILLDPVLDILCHDGLSPQVREQLLERQTALITSAIHSRQREGKEKAPSLSLGLVITKADLHPELSSSSSARKYLEEHAPNLFDRLKALGTKGTIWVGAVSAIGNCPEAPENPLPPKVIEPFGYEELFDWLRRLQWWKKWGRAVRTACMAAGAALAVLLVFLIGTGLDNVMYAEEMTSTRKSALEKLELPGPWFPWCVNPVQLKLTVAREEAKRISDKITESVVQSQLEEIGSIVDKIIKIRPPLIAEFERIKEEINKKDANMLFNMIVSTYKGSPGPCRDLCHKYLVRYPNGENAEKVKEIQDLIEKDAKTRDALAIRQIVCGNRTTMLNKAVLIDSFIKNHTPMDSKSMRLATGLARQLADNGTYSLNMKSVTGFQARYDIIVSLTCNTISSKIKSLRMGSEFQWPGGENIPIKWRVGDRIALEVFDDGYIYDSKIAEFAFTDAFDSLLKLLDPVSLNPTPGYAKESGIKLQVEITSPSGAGINTESHKAFRDFIHPGSFWENFDSR